jgi:SAM-dependent MidA family methyltransferase
MELETIIKRKMITDGEVSFSDFMDMALYYPGLGYYTSPGEKIGERGDYYTSATLTPVFGEIIAMQLEEMWHMLGEEKFTIVEYGAGTGALCKSILGYLKGNKEFYSQLEYCIVEKSEAMRSKEKEVLDEKVSWYDDIRQLPKISGCILSNELVDNFPVHQVVMKDELMEVFVGYDKGFVELLKPASETLKDYFQQLDVSLSKNFRTEINIHAAKWINEIASNLQRGFVITIDYGFPSAELYACNRSRGTLLCYYQHSVHDNPYIHVGKQDITAHINFSALRYFGSVDGLECSGLALQSHFLHALGIATHMRRSERSNNPGNEKIMQLQQLLSGMGDKLKVMIQHKGVPLKKLAGMQFSKGIF